MVVEPRVQMPEALRDRFEVVPCFHTKLYRWTLSCVKRMCAYANDPRLSE